MIQFRETSRFKYHETILALRLITEETQKDLVRLVGARGLCLDVYSVDDRNQQYDLEVQRADKGARPERSRYHASALDVESLDANQDFETLPATYIIFITENDIFMAGEAVYSIRRINLTTGNPFDDRQYILYANASYKGDGLIGDLMHDFLCSDPEEMRTPLMAEKTRYLKSHPKGVELMCKIMEDLREEAIQRGIEQGIEQGVEQSRTESIKNVMESLKYSAQQAMDLLKIPAAEQPKYLTRL